MKILVIGNDVRINELKKKISDEHQVIYNNVHEEVKMSTNELRKIDLIIDLNFDNNPSHFENYAHLKKPVIVSSVKKQLAETIFEYEGVIKCNLIGLNAIPTFLKRDIAEISLAYDNDKNTLDKVMKSLNWNYHLVKDRVGMVTPRIVFMIINEACFTLQEGTANIANIDLGMKLGTNYPMGPFEWADAAGIKNVYETLAAIYNDTKDERYKICPLLKTKYLKEEPFYVKK
jgi:3-hydroxybutyryl-CoA dehydrogenase